MTQKQLTRQSLQEKLKARLEFNQFLISVIAGLLSIAGSLLGVFLSVYVSLSKSPRTDILSTKTLYFVGGIVLLAFIIIGIASVMRRRNRSVILLKQRLAEIYVSALRKSALNPQLESSTSHE